mgnify:FL=1
MDTRDLTSYYPGYEDRDNDAKVPFEDYRILEDKLEIYKQAIDYVEEVLLDDEQYTTEEKFEELKRIIEEMKEELWKNYLITAN